MKHSSTRNLIGAILILAGVVLGAGSLALRSWGSRTVETSSGSAPPLSTTERGTLTRDGSDISSLPQAMREVPDAMVDAARADRGDPLDRTRASEILFEHPELSPLLKAVEHPTVVADSLAGGLRPVKAQTEVPLLPLGSTLLFFVVPGVLAVLLGAALRSRRLWSGAQRLAAALCLVAALVVLTGMFAPIDSGLAPWKALTQATGQGAMPVSTSILQGDLSQLEEVYDDVVPALQYAGAVGHQVLNPEAAVQVLGESPHLAALNRFVTDFSALYGVGVLITQQQAGSSAAPNGSPAMRWLDWLGVFSALLFLSLGFAALLMRRRGRNVVTSSELADNADLFVSAGIAGSS
jgi:hypothetical protein